MLQRIVRRWWRAVGLCALVLARPVAGQSSVSGTVFDSVAGKPIRGATVRFVGIDDPAQVRTVFSDSSGRYAVPAIPSGKYLAGFAHPLLDSLGYDPPPTELQLTGSGAVHHFATPSAPSMIAAVCDAGARQGGLLIGFVRDATHGDVLRGAGLLASWSEIDSSGPFPSVVQRISNVPATDNGWFAACGLPAQRPVLVRGVTESDSTGLVRMSFEPGAVRIARFLIPVRSTATAGTTQAPTAQLRATVRDSSGRPVPNARATLWGTEGETSSAASGQLTLGGLPTGTQTLEVSAIGYEPVAVPVELFAGSTVAVDVLMPSRATVLSGVRVTGAASNPRLAGFNERMQDAKRGINFGYFINQDEIDRRKPSQFSNLLEGLGGIEVQRLGDPRMVVIRGGIRHGALRCAMAVYLDNVRIIGGLSPSDDNVNVMVDPTTIAGVEVYPFPVGVPPRYQSLNGLCGVVLIWTK